MKLSPRLLILASVVGLLLVAFVGIGIYGLIAGPPEPSAEATQSATADRQPGTPNAPVVLAELPETDDAEEFARAVALALFDWDTMRLSGPEQIIEHLMTVSDPSGYEAPGLYQDLGRYLPTAEQWRQLREYDTRQQLTDVEMTVPTAWDAITADPANELAEGTIAITVDATRVREGGWHGETTRDESPVEFTMFLACPPATEHCALLRLSALGSTLR